MGHRHGGRSLAICYDKGRPLDREIAGQDRYDGFGSVYVLNTKYYGLYDSKQQRYQIGVW